MPNEECESHLKSVSLSHSLIEGIKIPHGLILWYTLNKHGNVILEVMSLLISLRIKC